jgi:peptide/nickel transport system ATP-binding protein
MTDSGQQPPRRRRSPAPAEPAAQPTPAEQAVPAERAESAEWLKPTEFMPAAEPPGTDGPRPVDRPAEGSRRRRGRAVPLLEDGPGPEAASRPTGRFLEVRDLRVHFPTQDGLVRSVDGLSFGLERGRTLGIVGESGSGKSVSSLAIMGLHEKTGARISGEIWLDGEELLGMGSEDVRRRRGQKMAMIFQDPLSSLHPYYRVGDQIIEAYRIHVDATKKQARQHAIDLLGRVGIPQPARRVDDYPHQFSGGMRQRAMIAMALCCDPALLIADEPTTALDVTVQAEILDLIRDLQAEFGSAVIIITHDLGVVAELAETILVMYAGRGAEYGQAEEIFLRPEHPYTWGLLGSMPRLDRAGAERLMPIPGTPPSLIRVPPGCAFHPRCRYERLNRGASQTEVPAMVESAPGHQVACHLPAETRRRIWEDEVKPQLAGDRTVAR